MNVYTNHINHSKHSQKGSAAPAFLLLVIVLLIIGGGLVIYKNKKSEVTATPSSPSGNGQPTQPTDQKEQKIRAVAGEVLAALGARDYQKLQTLVSPDGLSMDLYPNFDPKTNLIPRTEISLMAADKKIYLWGYTDGKGDPINLTRAKFLTSYIYPDSVDYSKAPEIALNKKLGGGNSINSIARDVSGRDYMAFHYPGFNPEYAGIDWTTLYLIFDSVDGEYKLRGIAKDNWTI